jgi:hypothetical protein
MGSCAKYVKRPAEDGDGVGADNVASDGVMTTSPVSAVPSPQIDKNNERIAKHFILGPDRPDPAVPQCSPFVGGARTTAVITSCGEL